jgi:uncharacterized coiled-coil DUF342 family protein
MKTNYFSEGEKMTELTIEQAFEKMYLSEIVPLLKQKEKLNAKRDEISEKTDKISEKTDEISRKISKLYAKRSEFDAKKSELYAKKSELYAKISKLYAKIFWKFVKFEKENYCKVNWKNWDYDFKLENLEVGK